MTQYSLKPLSFHPAAATKSISRYLRTKLTAIMSQRSRGACSALRISRISVASLGSWSRATRTSSSEFCTGIYTKAIASKIRFLLPSAALVSDCSSEISIFSTSYTRILQGLTVCSQTLTRVFLHPAPASSSAVKIDTITFRYNGIERKNVRLKSRGSRDMGEPDDLGVVENIMDFKGRRRCHFDLNYSSIEEARASEIISQTTWFNLSTNPQIVQSRFKNLMKTDVQNNSEGKAMICSLLLVNIPSQADLRPAAKQNKEKFGQWWKLNPPDFQRNEDPLIWSWFAIKNKAAGAWLQVAIIAMLVSIWRIRNGVVFDKKKVVIDFEFRKSKELAFQWLSSRNSKFKLELCNWISNPSNIM
ncbi:hypothetical protein LXL04_037610 [Taraxacum kok-saghyz]